MKHSYIDLIQHQWEKLLELYLQFEDKKPVMLYDLDKQEIFAYPYEQFKAKLGRKSQASLEQQYQRAVQSDHMVIFVKDKDESNMASYSVKIYEDEAD